jgi:hypothetical protein
MFNAPIRHDLVDNRFYYVDEEAYVTATCAVAFRVAAKTVRAYNSQFLSMEEIVKMLQIFKDNPSIVGFCVEAAVLAAITKYGLRDFKQLANMLQTSPLNRNTSPSAPSYRHRWNYKRPGLRSLYRSNSISQPSML